jgi:hypothetical protein
MTKPKGKARKGGFTIRILFSGRESSSIEALRFPSLTSPLLSARDGIVNIGPAPDTVEDSQAQAQTCDVDRDSRKIVDVLKTDEIPNCM